MAAGDTSQFGTNVSRFIPETIQRVRFVRYELIAWIGFFYMPFQLWWIHMLLDSSVDWNPLVLPCSRDAEHGLLFCCYIAFVPHKVIASP